MSSDKLMEDGWKGQLIGCQEMVKGNEEGSTYDGKMN